MSEEVKNNNNNEEEKKFQIKVVEKAAFPSSLNIAPMKLSDLAASLNGLFSPFKDFIGSEFRVDTVNGVNSISYSLCFLLGHSEADGIASAFVPVDAQIKADTRLERQIAREKASLDGKKARLTQEGIDGLEPYILGFIRRKNQNWYKSCVTEICERDRFGNVSKVYVRVNGIDYLQCIKEVWGRKIKTHDGDHEAVYDLRLKRPLTGMTVNMGTENKPSMDWLIEFIQADENCLNEFYREIGLFMNPNSPTLNIIPRR